MCLSVEILRVACFSQVGTFQDCSLKRHGKTLKFITTGCSKNVAAFNGYAQLFLNEANQENHIKPFTD